jgi:hypothetical protein
MITSSIDAGSIWVLCTTSFIARDPSWGAVKFESAPLNDPIGVLAPAMITISFIISYVLD